MSTKRLSSLEISDLEDEFVMQHGDEVGQLEQELVDIFISTPENYEERIDRCNRFIETTDKIKEYCLDHGVGGSSYYRTQIKGDPRLPRIKNELKFLKRYPNGATLREAILEVYKLLKKKNALLICDIFDSLSGLGHVDEALDLMVKINSIAVDNERPKVYYIPSGEGLKALAALRCEEFRKEAEIAAEIKEIESDPPELTVDLGFIEEAVEDIEQQITAINEAIATEKKKGFFGKLFSR